MPTTNLFDLTGKRALITGSSRGLGLAMATALANAGAAVVLNARDGVALGAAAHDLAATGATVNAVAFDVTNRDSINEAVNHIEDEIGPIDILVNNAGMQFRSSLEAFPPEKFDQVIATNLTSVFNVSQPVARHMISRGTGKIVNICSLLSELSRPSVAPYAATKAAVANITRGMAVDWAKHGLNVNGIAPGYFATELNDALLKDDKFNAWIESRTPMGRWGQPEELGGAIVFLASEASRFVNGHILYVDGAFTATV
ncbi:glucose 1-dehydrogenase [Devosia psychrophila]|uniref:Gluconate 5-dehydrogenase n=1 Tax=Devosia psychrophila TaxID=728005 RepID=A0A0F5PZ05_9HYPH|nr:glucose 1-dehydrogenase [Devosia psychrophila]KKC33616.1 gluconate 5-dehydrogenase [Devosia psychrophila]SFC60568.1 gluconate 5-dehydrogenase [Devosia psychrophila]